MEEIESVEWEEETEFWERGGEAKWSKWARKDRKLELSGSPCSICLEDGTRA
jgi:hypothetical protein